MSGDSEDKKYFPKVIVRYSPTIFGSPMPTVPISLKGISQPLQALVDSGATNSLLSYDWAIQKNIKIDESRVLTGGGVGSGYEFYLSEPVEVDILGYKYQFKFDILLRSDPIWPCILGQNSIFRLAKITFKRFRNEFEVFFRKDIN